MTAIPGATGLGDVGDDLERIVTYDRLAEAAAANGVVTLAPA